MNENKETETPKKESTFSRFGVERIVGCDDAVILDTSTEAAKFVTDIKGWVSKDGFFYGNNKASESAARYAGCTHRACGNCGKPAEKMYTVCPQCREILAIERYQKRELVEWDGKTPLYSDAYDEFFFDGDTLHEFINDLHRTAPEEIRLILCEPGQLHQVDEDHWCDDLPEDGELPDSVFNALDALNLAIREAGTISWVPGELRVSV